MKISEFIKQLQDIAVIEGDDINIYYYRERIGPIATMFRRAHKRTLGGRRL